MKNIVKIKSYEKGLHFKDGEFAGVLNAGTHWFMNPFTRNQVDISSMRGLWILHKDLDLIVKSGLLGQNAVVLEVGDRERALVWFDGHFQTILKPGRYAYWTGFRDVRVEKVDISRIRFESADLKAIVNSSEAAFFLESVFIGEGQLGLLFIEGKYSESLEPGEYYFWKKAGKYSVHVQNMREQVLDISGQDIMTADKVSLRMNAVLSWKISDPLKAFMRTADAGHTLYRESQLALRAAVGTRELDALLADKNSLGSELISAIREEMAELGITVLSAGIRDMILPGEMKTLLNKVTEAKKAAEANIITRREELAAARTQANTAKMLSENPALMRMRELEVLEKIAGTAKLNVVLGEKGISERIMTMI